MLSVRVVRLLRCPLCHPGGGTGRATYSEWRNVKRGATEIPVADKVMKIDVGTLARFADGSCVTSMGDTSVMVTAVSKPLPPSLTPTSFIPLTVEYRQKSAAAGRIPTNFLRRELGPSVTEVLTSRLLDRSVRPLFPHGFRSTTQLECNLLAVDSLHDPEVLSINGASASLAVSDIPWNGPVGAVRVGLIDSSVIINPDRKQREVSDLDLIVVGTAGGKVVMLEASANQVPYDKFVECVSFGLDVTQQIVGEIEDLQRRCGKDKRPLQAAAATTSTSPPAEGAAAAAVTMQDKLDAVSVLAGAKMREIFTDPSYDKASRHEATMQVRDEVSDSFREAFPEDSPASYYEIFGSHCRELYREQILSGGARFDGRGLRDMREISCQTDLYKPLHGSALFQRGQTQVLCTVTFDSLESAFRSDTMSWIVQGVKEKNFMVHYEFPKYATADTGRPGVVDRREMGHGILAEKGLRPVIPDNFPFTIRLTAEVLESNGSSSMASICGGSLALKDAGVPISNSVAGVAMGLISKCNEETGALEDYKILTDIVGAEDYMGDMDFKVSGSRSGVTALQADIKVAGLPLRVMSDTVTQAREALTHILTHMDIAQPLHRLQLKDNGPRSERITVPVTKRSKFVGHSGLNLRRLTQRTGVQVSQVDEQTYSIFAPNQDAMDEAKAMIDAALSEKAAPQLEFGKIYNAKIVEICDIGCMVTLYPGMMPALLPNSQLGQGKVRHPSVLGLNTGQEILVKYYGTDPVTGQTRLSRKMLTPLGTATGGVTPTDTGGATTPNPWKVSS